jgi:hypothetical protein
MSSQASGYLLYGMSGLLNLDGPQWQRHKKALYPLFHASNVDLYFDTFHDSVRRHARAWARGAIADEGMLPKGIPDKLPDTVSASGGPDLVAACRAAGLESLLVFAFAADPGSPQGQELGRLFTLYSSILADMGSGVGGACALPLGVYRIVKCSSDIRSAVKQMLVDRFGSAEHPDAAALRDKALESKGDRSSSSEAIDGLRAMWEAGFTLQEMASEANHVYGAHKAAGFSIACALWRIQLDENRDWLDAMRAEWLDVLGPAMDVDRLSLERPRSNSPKRSDAGKLPITAAVIKEVLRMHVVSLCECRSSAASAPLATLCVRRYWSPNWGPHHDRRGGAPRGFGDRREPPRTPPPP